MSEDTYQVIYERLVGRWREIKEILHIDGASDSQVVDCVKKLATFNPEDHYRIAWAALDKENKELKERITAQCEALRTSLLETDDKPWDRLLERVRGFRIFAGKARESLDAADKDSGKPKADNDALQRRVDDLLAWRKEIRELLGLPIEHDGTQSTSEAIRALIEAKDNAEPELAGKRLELWQEADKMLKDRSMPSAETIDMLRFMFDLLKGHRA